MALTWHYGTYLGGKFYGEGECLSSDPEPKENIMNGSKLIEMDTGKVKIFDEENQTWRKWGENNA